MYYNVNVRIYKDGDSLKISVIIPTRNAQNYINDLIIELLNQTIEPYEIIIIDTNSKDNTREISKKYSKVKFISIKDNEFNHGGTRNKGAEIAKGDIIVFMTQDAIPYDNYFIENLVKPLFKDDIVASYGRQIPRNNASELEKFSRYFNYPEFDIIKSKEDINILGIKAFFFSNVCSAFIKGYFYSIKGFPEDTIMNEDMIIASKILFDNKKTFYSSNAKVIHSHNYTYIQQFRRNFDVGVVFNDNKEYFENIKNESEGIKFVKEAIKYLVNTKKAHLIPNLIIQSGFKFIGYKFGKKYEILPINIVKKMSMHSFYFN